MEKKKIYWKVMMTFVSSFLMIVILNYFLNFQMIGPFFQLMSWDISSSLAQSLDLAYFGKITAIIFGETTALSWVFYVLSKNLF